MHQHLQMLDEENNVQIIVADPCPFSAEINNAEARLYSRNKGPLSTSLETRCANMLVKTGNVSKPITLEYLQDFRLKALDDDSLYYE